MEKIHLTYVNNRLTRVKSPNVFGRYSESKNTFEIEDTNNLLPQNNNHMVIMIQHAKWDVKRVLNDLGSSADILFWSTFQGLEKDPHNIGSFQGFLIDLSGKQVQVNGYFTVKTKIWFRGERQDQEVKYIILDATSPYNIILGRLALYLVGEVQSTHHLNLKYPLPNGHMSTVK